MNGFLADANIQGHVDYLVALMKRDPWDIFWAHFCLGYYHFSDLKLSPSAPDGHVWKTCQEHGLILITNNRNKDGPDSLEETILKENHPHSLPIFTIADAERLRRERSYADRVIETLFKYVFQEANLLGTGRLYLP